MSGPLNHERFVSTEEAEGIIAEAESLIASGVDAVSQEVWRKMCSRLAEAARATWWRCDCGAVSPAEIELDAVCSQCGAMHRLPPRLSRAPWALYVPCLCHALPGTWFDRLSEWLESNHLGSSQSCVEPAWFEDLTKGGAYPDSPDSTAGGAAYCGGAFEPPPPIDARGAVPPESKRIRCIRCIDGMRVFESGRVEGLQWIALPMM